MTSDVQEEFNVSGGTESYDFDIVITEFDLGCSRVGSEEEPGWYRVMDDLEFGLDIHELSEGEWKPYRQGFFSPLCIKLGLRYLTAPCMHHIPSVDYFSIFAAPQLVSAGMRLLSVVPHG